MRTAFIEPLVFAKSESATKRAAAEGRPTALTKSFHVFLEVIERFVKIVVHGKNEPFCIADFSFTPGFRNDLQPDKRFIIFSDDNLFAIECGLY